MYPRSLSFLRGAVNFALRTSPLQPVMRGMAGDQLAVLAYHRVSDPAAFEAQLGYLVRHAHPVSLEAVRVAAKTRTALPRRSVLLTFDDGDISVLDDALPLLRERGVPAVAFVCPGVVDTSEPLWFDELTGLLEAGAKLPAWAGRNGDQAEATAAALAPAQQRALFELLRASLPDGAFRVSRRQLTAADLLRLEHDGVAVGNHSLNHPLLTACDAATIETEIGEAHQRLAAILGHEPIAFAYPAGDVDTRVLDRVTATGYELAFDYDHRLSSWPAPSPLQISRLRGDSADSVDRLAVALSGLHSVVWRAAERAVRRAPGPAPTLTAIDLAVPE